jgi:Fic family protein
MKIEEIDFGFLKVLGTTLERVEVKKTLLDESRPLPNLALSRLKENISLEWTYNSNAIEGNTLSLNETKVVLENGMTIGGKSLREHFEVINHSKAIDYLESIVKDNEPLRAIDILKMHEIVLKNIEEEFAGRLRNGMVRIVGANFNPPSPSKVSDLIDELIEFTNVNRTMLSAPVLASIFHHKLVWIHPFFDGNGRTGRLAMNLLLMNAGYPPCVILKNDRKRYYAALNLANKGHYEKLALLVFQGLERSLNLYLEVIPGQYMEFEPISKIVNEPEVPYGMEYVSLLARRGEINAQKEGRVWYTTKEAVLSYAKSKGK